MKRKQYLAMATALSCLLTAFSACGKKNDPALPAADNASAPTVAEQSEPGSDTVPRQTVLTDLSAVHCDYILPDGTIWGSVKLNGEETNVHFNVRGEILHQLPKSVSNSVKYGVSPTVILNAVNRFWDVETGADITARYYDETSGESLVNVIVKENNETEFVILKTVESFESKHAVLRLENSAGEEMFTVSCDPDSLKRDFGIETSPEDHISGELTICYAGAGLYYLELTRESFPVERDSRVITLLLDAEKKLVHTFRMDNKIFVSSDGTVVYAWVNNWGGSILDLPSGQAVDFPEGYKPDDWTLDRQLPVGGGLIKAHGTTYGQEPYSVYLNGKGEIVLDTDGYPQPVYNVTRFYGENAWFSFTNGYVGAIDQTGTLLFEPVKAENPDCFARTSFIGCEPDFVIIKTAKDADRQILFADGTMQEIPDSENENWYTVLMFEDELYIVYNGANTLRVEK